MMEKLKPIFNNYDLSKLLEVTSLNRGIGTRKKSRTTTRNNRSGVSFLGTTSDLLTYEMSFSLIGDVISKRRILAEKLNVDEPKTLIFSDEPDKYYLAWPSLNIELDDKRRFAKGVIVWEIPDGIAFSVQDYTFSNVVSDTLKLDYIEVVNPGTEPMQLDMAVTFRGDNGFLGIENEDGTTKALFGSIEEVDGYVYETSEVLFDDHFTQDKGWLLNQGIIVPVTVRERRQEGTVNYKIESEDEGYMYPNNWGANYDAWHGPSQTKIIPPDKNGDYPINWRAGWRFDFNTAGSNTSAEKKSMIGHQSLTFIDQNDEIICGVVFEDNNKVDERSDMAIYIGERRVWDSKNTKDFYVTGRVGTGALAVVEILGGQITISFSYADIKKTYVANTSDAELRKITWYSAKYGDNLNMHQNLIRAINVRKHNVQNWQDIPNKFADGDILEYGKEGKNIYCRLNGLQGLQYRDPGSTLITAPPGTSKMYIAYSSFSETPEIILSGKAEYA